MSIVFINPYRYDPDAEDYINRVIAADVAAGNTSGLEVGVQDAYNTFFVGCKTDGIWDAIKASCILAGARTLAGALVPLVGTAPTNYNFVSGDYDRETGLVGNGFSKYIDSNRPGNVDVDTNAHFSVYHSTLGSTAVTRFYMGSNSSTAANQIDSNGVIYFKLRTVSLGIGAAASFYGASRLGNELTGRRYQTNQTSTSPVLSGFTTRNYTVFARNRTDSGPAEFTDARIAFYSIGESLDLALLDARITTLLSDLAAAIP